ncbi:MAG: RNA polymerase sigma-70 factor [Chitinophagaceae bacterium]|nr:RNA polymerase sigma-70 factor [Chitinophagaceae bacterium]
MLVHINSSDEKKLLQRLISGEETAFADVYTCYAPLLISYAAARLSSLEEARDIIQDLFVYLWDERKYLNINTSLRSYLFAAARYRIIDHIRQQLTRREYAAWAKKLIERVAADMEEEIAIKYLHHTLEHAIEDLPSRTQEIYRLSRYRHLAVKEIARELGLSEQTVKNQLTTALSYLRLSWDKLTLLLLTWLFL